MLGEAFPLYHLVMGDPISRVRYFLYIMFQTAVSGFSISLAVRFYTKATNCSDSQLLMNMRTLGLIISFVFIFSTWGLLDPSSVTELYLISGVHYFAIAFFGNLVVLESKHYNLPKLTRGAGGMRNAIMSSVMGLNINFLGIFSCAAAYLFVTFISIHAYSIFCVLLDIVFFFFLIAYKKYYTCFFYLVKNKKEFIEQFLIYLAALVFCVAIAYIASITKIIVLISVFGVYVLDRNMRKEVDAKKVNCILTTNFAYGTAFSLIITPMLLLTLPSEKYIHGYSGVAILEPVLGALMMLLILFVVVKKWLKSDFTSTKGLVIASSLLVVMLPISLYLLSYGYHWYWVALVYFVYSWVESSSRYVTTEITFSLQKDKVSVETNFYGAFIYRGVVPMFYMLLTAFFSCFYSLPDSIILSNILMVVLTLLLCYNLRSN